MVVESVENCYQALGILHTAYCMIPGKFKDYISAPKQNNYQGLHTTVVGPLQHRMFRVISRQGFFVSRLRGICLTCPEEQHPLILLMPFIHKLGTAVRGHASTAF